jgi:hypothetical protein
MPARQARVPGELVIIRSCLHLAPLVLGSARGGKPAGFRTSGPHGVTTDPHRTRTACLALTPSAAARDQ